MNRSIESYLESLFQAASYESFHPDEDVIGEMLANREAAIINQSLHDDWKGFESITNVPDDPIGDHPGQISNNAYNLILAYETGGRAYYEKVYKNAPCWPGYSSGITIGFGYDLGYYSEGEFVRIWMKHLGESQIDRLKPWIGFSTKDPDRSSKVNRAKNAIRQLSDVQIPWETGESVYIQYTVPTQLEKVYRYLPEVATLSADCCGALVSLVFNRGASFGKSGQRYQEMRAIKSHLQSGDLERIPDELRSMKRLWKSQGLRKRRDEEAALFEQGLGSDTDGMLSDSDGSFDSFPVDEAFRESPPASAGSSWRDVRWSQDDENHPDYRHVVGLGEGDAEFEFSADDLDLLIDANEFRPKEENGVIIFALRGCRLQCGDSAVRESSLQLVDVRPDHRGLRCVVGVFHENERELSAFAASTVPNSHFVWNYSVNGNAGNLLPTGCYHYVSGSHGNGSFPSCLLLEKPAVVLRTTDDLVYGTKDRWERGRFGNHIHPSHATYEWADFSGAGGLTVQGSYDKENGSSGEWRAFQEAAGLQQDGVNFDVVLLTGLEGRIAAQIRRSGLLGVSDPLVIEQLCRLRSGSQGERVIKLQQALGITADGDFGSNTRMALIKKQQERGLPADSIFSCEMDDLLDFEIYPRQQPPVPESTSLSKAEATVSERIDVAPAAITEFPSSSFESIGEYPLDENDYIPEIFESKESSMFEGTGSVYWPSKDKNSPCYFHLLEEGAEGLPDPGNFELGVREIELLISANRFDPVGKDSVIAFGIRGVRFRNSLEKLEDVDYLPLKDARPDHKNFRCIIGYYFRESGTFSAYTGSTVPWHGYMSRGLKNNLLPTGCYIYKVGEHKPASGPHRWVTGLRMSDASGAWSGPATVLRTRNDNVFGLQDSWDQCSPSDNVHCAYSDTTFSSLGCQTVKGNKGGGLWSKFQKPLFKLGNNSRVDYILLTGTEVAIAGALINEGAAADSPEVRERLTRLRTGSSGEEVKRLQVKLGVNPTGYFGAETKYKLTRFQDENGHARDGIFSPALDQGLGWEIFDSLEDPSSGSDTPTEPSVPDSTIPSEPVPVAPIDAPSPAPTPSTPSTPPPVPATPAPATPAPETPVPETPVPATPNSVPPPVPQPAAEEPVQVPPDPVSPAVPQPEAEKPPVVPPASPPAAPSPLVVPTTKPSTTDAPVAPSIQPRPAPIMVPKVPDADDNKDIEIDTSDSNLS